jgi:hypothetical protein
MTIKIRWRARWVTLLVYLFVLAGNTIVLIFLGPETIRRLTSGPELSDIVNALVCLLAASLVLAIVNSLARLARLRIEADEERVWVPAPFGGREVRRSDLAAIRRDRLTSPLALGLEVYRFITRGGGEAFHVQAGVFSQGAMASLAAYLGVPIDLRAPVESKQV